MLWDIIRKEVQDSISTFKFVVTFVIVVVLVISGLEIGSKNYTEQRGEVVKQRSLNQQTLESQFDWTSVGWTGVVESKRPHVLSVIDSGVDNSLGRLAYVNTFDDPRLDESRNLVSPILAVFGDVDLTFVVKIILSLFVILLTYDAVSGEKERGTLKLALANEVPRAKLLLGKIIGGFFSIFIPFLLPLVLGLAYLMGFHSDVMADFSGEAWVRLALIVGIYLLYLAVFFALGLFVSSVCHRSATSFIVLLMIWVLFVTIIPRLSLTATERMKQYESYSTLQTRAFREIAERRTELFKEYMPRLTQATQQLVIREFQPGGGSEEGIVNPRVELFNKITEIRRDVMDRMDRDYVLRQADQITTAESISRMLSPASAMSFAVSNLAGTGWARQQAYLDQLREFQGKFVEYVERKSITDVFNTIWDMFEKKNLEVDMGQITFEFKEQPLGTVIEMSLFDVGVLALMAIIFFAAASVAFMRYDVR